MRLNHLDLCVPDVAAAASFFVNGFGFAVLNVVGEHEMAILRGEDGFVVVLTHAPDAHYPKSFHFGFLQDSPEGVRQAYARLLAAGIDIPAPPAESPGALVMFCRMPSGIPVEVSYRGPPPT